MPRRPPPGLDAADNELATLEAVHLFVEILDHFFSNVCELDLVFNFHKVCIVCIAFCVCLVCEGRGGHSVCTVLSPCSCLPHPYPPRCTSSWTR